MSDGENHHHGKNEILIIKRHGGGHEDGHHGGAWKIAYADFMTAMMAFFLVMWLVNAANEETKASVASYFNPIKLTDETPAQKGLKKPTEQAQGEQTKDKSTSSQQKPKDGAAAASGEDQSATSGDHKDYSEADYFENPYSVLSEIAQEVGQQANVSVKGEGGASDSGPATGASGGEAYRDPFSPDFWTQQVEVTGKDQTTSEATPKARPDQKRQQQQAALDAPAEDAADATPVPTPRPDPKTATKAEDKTADKTKDKTEDRTADPQDVKKAEDLRQTLQQALAGVPGKVAEGLVVKAAEGGLLVSISDQVKSQMFNVGSAVPSPELVVAMEKIGKVLSGRPGDVLIRGHTDGRQFKGGHNDNWQLSTARAQSAYFMLVRGGLDEKRVQQISGFADRRLQDPENPLDDANRRIEILIKADKG
nr:MotB family protein [uncultured Gellertiella sp.]